MIDDESLVKTRTNTCLSYASAIPSYSVTRPDWADSPGEIPAEETRLEGYYLNLFYLDHVLNGFRVYS